MNPLLRTIIVEDEPLAAEILSEYVRDTPFLELTHICYDAIHALDVLRNHPVEVIFLDIQLPKVTGLEFLKSLLRPPKIIITSAYHEFAVDGFDLQVVDYLLKPVEHSRYLRAVEKLMPRGPQKAVEAEFRPSTPTRPYYFFTVNKRSVKIYLDEILYIESLKDTVTIHTAEKSYSTHYQLGELEAIMPNHNFLRIHRSFLVAIDKIDSFSAAEVEIAGRVLPIGRSHKLMVMDQLGKNS